MNILLVAATPFEIAPTLNYLEQHFTTSEDAVFENETIRITPLITGVGMTATAWQLGLYLGRSRPDWVLNAGIAGAIDRSFQLGDVVQIGSECFGDLGVEEADGRFSDLFQLGLTDPNTPPFINGLLYNPAADSTHFLPSAKGLTINRVHGYLPSIEDLAKKYPSAQVETMEGAALFYACLMVDIPFLEIRAISNYVESRNRNAWQIPLAIERLNSVLIEMLAGILASRTP